MQDNANPDRDQPDDEDAFVDRPPRIPDAEGPDAEGPDAENQEAGAPESNDPEEDSIDDETSELDQAIEDESSAHRRSLGSKLTAICTSTRVGVFLVISAAVALTWWATRPIQKPVVVVPPVTPEVRYANLIEQIRNGESTQLHTPDFPIDDEQLNAIPMDVLLEAADRRALAASELESELAAGSQTDSSTATDDSASDAPLPPGADAVDPESVAALSPKLDTVLIDQGIITDAGMATLARIPDLRHVRLRLSPITDEGLKPLLNCRTLWFLNLPHSRLTEKGIRSLAAIPKLRQLRLGSTEVGNDTSRAVAELKSLRGLHLIGIPITDEGLKRITELPHLESLYLDDSAVTESGWDWLFQNHPQLHVHINQRHHDRDPQLHRHE